MAVVFRTVRSRQNNEQRLSAEQGGVGRDSDREGIVHLCICASPSEMAE